MFEIYSKSDCPWCQLAKEYFFEHDMYYTEYLYDDYTARQAMYDMLRLVNPQRTVPQIFFMHGDSREYIGGYNDLIRADFTDRLQMENFDAEF
jgi:glutaredoxin 3